MFCSKVYTYGISKKAVGDKYCRGQSFIKIQTLFAQNLHELRSKIRQGYCASLLKSWFSIKTIEILWHCSMAYL